MSLGPPCCIGCGFYIGALDFLPETMGYFSITKLEDMGVNSLWIARYRLIIRNETANPHLDKGIHLSDTTENAISHSVWNMLTVPLNPLHDDSNHPLANDGIIAVPVFNLPDDANQRPTEVHGYALHSRCWKLIERVFGSDVKQNLDTMPEAIRQKAQLGRSAVLRPPNFFSSFYEEPDEGVLVHDPVKIHELETLLRPEPTPVTASIPHTSHPLSCGVHDIPLEIKYMILNYVHYGDVNNLLCAFQWHIPDQYWRSRFPADIIYEVDESYEAEDWRFLCVKAERLMESWKGLLNHSRILGVLNGAKEIYDEILAAEKDATK